MIRFRCLSMLRVYLDGFYTGEGQEPRCVELQALRSRQAYRLVYGADELGGFSAEILIAAPVIRSFRRAGRLTFRAANVSVEGGSLTGPDLALIDGFMTRCRG